MAVPFEGLLERNVATEAKRCRAPGPHLFDEIEWLHAFMGFQPFGGLMAAQVSGGASMKLFGVRWRFYGTAQPQHGWKAAGLLFGVFTLAVLSAVMWNRSIENSTAFWAANGVLAAGLLLLPRRMGVAFAAACTSRSRVGA